MATIFNDTFTESANTNLQSHTPNTGTSWTRLWGTDASTRNLQVENLADQIRCSGNSGDYGLIYTADVTYPTANYEVQATFITTFSTITPLYLLARVQDQENMYAVRLVLSSGGSNAQLYKKVSGTWSTLGSAVTIADGSVVKLSVNGTAIKVYDDGAEVISVTDSAISSAGKAGIGHGGGAELVASTDDTRATNMLDLFSVNDLGAGGTTYNQSTDGGVTPAGAALKSAAKLTAGSVTPSGATVKQTGKVTSGSLTPSGALFRDVQKVLAGALSPVGALTRTIGKVFSGSLMPSAILSSIRTFLKDLAGSLTPSGEITRSTDKTTGGSITPDGAVTRAISKAFTGTLASAGTISKGISKLLAGVLSWAGTLVSEFIGTVESPTNPPIIYKSEPYRIHLPEVLQVHGAEPYRTHEPEAYQVHAAEPYRVYEA